MISASQAEERDYSAADLNEFLSRFFQDFLDKVVDTDIRDKLKTRFSEVRSFIFFSIQIN